MEAVNRLGLVMRQHPDRVLSEATTSPAFPDSDVAFLKKAFAKQQNAGNAVRGNTSLP
jgi:hypothetical protein